MIVIIVFATIGACAAGWVFWLIISQIMFIDAQNVELELHKQAMTKGTDPNGSITCLRKALDI